MQKILSYATHSASEEKLSKVHKMIFLDKPLRISRIYLGLCVMKDILAMGNTMR